MVRHVVFPDVDDVVERVGPHPSPGRLGVLRHHLGVGRAGLGALLVSPHGGDEVLPHLGQVGRREERQLNVQLLQPDQMVR